MRRVLLALLAVPTLAGAQASQAEVLKKIGIDQKLGAQVPRDIPFRDESGRSIRFGDLFGRRPLILLPVFYRCSGICAVEMDALSKSIVKMRAAQVGREYDVVFVSIHPKETPELAKAKEAKLVEVYGRPGTEGGWHLLTGSMPEIRRLTDSVGFRFTYDEQKDLVNHPAGLMILTPEGKVSRYIYGASYPTSLLREALLEAAQEKIGPKAELTLLGCVMVDPITGERTIVVKNVVKVAGILTVVVLFGSIAWMSLKGKRSDQGGQASLA